jgi:16S rRNA (cytosine967-C5)-methyltransferase
LRYYRSRYNSALQLLKGYKYPEPFHIAAKNFFKQSKKFGSKDRKAISEICYTYLRCGLAFKDVPIEEGLLLSGLFMDFEPASDWNNQCKELSLDYKVDDNFFEEGSAVDFVSNAIGKEIDFYKEDFLMQDFEHYNLGSNVRFRPKNWAKDHTDDEPRKLGTIGSKELTLINQNLDATTQVQDLSSQYMCHNIKAKDDDKIWDVCCGAGGKTLNLSSESRSDFYLSDIRPQIIENAKSRFKSMHYDANYAVADLSKPQQELKFGAKSIKEGYFDTIIADVPCSGSGTWFRTPEHFTRFDYNSLTRVSDKQKNIVANAAKFLKKGGLFYYITCSVFNEENTAVKDWIEENTELKLDREVSFDGIKQRADGMYMAVFLNP